MLRMNEWHLEVEEEEETKLLAREGWLLSEEVVLWNMERHRLHCEYSGKSSLRAGLQLENAEKRQLDQNIV